MSFFIFDHVISPYALLSWLLTFLLLLSWWFKGPPSRLASLTHVCQQQSGNTDHSIFSCPNISECFHIRSESLETARHLLFMSAINYSPWYELQSRKAKLETRTEGWGWREAHCKEKKEKCLDPHRGSEEEINRVKRIDQKSWEETPAESELNSKKC